MPPSLLVRVRSGAASMIVTVGFCVPAAAGSSVSLLIPPAAVTRPWLDTCPMEAGKGLSTTARRVMVTALPASRVPMVRLRLVGVGPAGAAGSVSASGALSWAGSAAGGVASAGAAPLAVSCVPSVPWRSAAASGSTVLSAGPADGLSTLAGTVRGLAAGMAGATGGRAQGGCPKVGAPVTETAEPGLAACMAGALACVTFNVPTCVRRMGPPPGTLLPEILVQATVAACSEAIST